MFFTKDRVETPELDLRLHPEKKEEDIEQFFIFCSKLLENIETKLKFFDIESIKLKTDETKKHAIFLRSRIYMTLLSLSPFKESNRLMRSKLMDLDFQVSRILNNDKKGEQDVLNKTKQNLPKEEKENVLRGSMQKL
jgi:hypothetical protein